MASILTNRPELKKVLDSAAEVAGYLWQKGWAERNGGNLTLNITEYVLYEELARNHFIVVIKALPHSIPYALLVMESKRHPGRTYDIFLPEWIPQVATFIGSLQEDLKPSPAVFRWQVLESTQPAAERVTPDVIHSQRPSLQYPVFPLELS